METFLQVLVSLCCVFLAGLGIKTMFGPNSMVDILDIEPRGRLGLNTMRGFLGGLFIGCSVLLATGLITGNTSFILAVALNLSVVLVGRVLGFMLDGFDKSVALLIVTELIMVVIFIGAHMQLGFV